MLGVREKYVELDTKVRGWLGKSESVRPLLICSTWGFHSSANKIQTQKGFERAQADSSVHRFDDLRTSRQGERAAFLMHATSTIETVVNESHSWLGSL